MTFATYFTTGLIVFVIIFIYDALTSYLEFGFVDVRGIDPFSLIIAIVMSVLIWPVQIVLILISPFINKN